MPLGGWFLSSASLDGAIIIKGDITVPGDFPAPGDVEEGWYYRVLADVTDNDPTKTNTNQSFIAGSEIVWDDGSWTVLGIATGAEIYQQPATVDVASTDLEVIDTIPLANGYVVDWVVRITDKTTDDTDGLRVLGVYNGTSVDHTVYALLGAELDVDLSVVVSGPNILLRAQNNEANTVAVTVIRAAL